MNYDVLVLGSGPGGYVAAIRASQLGLKTAVIEKAELGGICLNWGCIPTKALLKSASVYESMVHAEAYGLKSQSIEFDFSKVVDRSRGVADKMSKGIEFLMKKNKIDVINGFGKLVAANKIAVTDTDDKVTEYEAKNIVLATGARSRQLPNLPQDGKKIIGYREALTLPELPKSMVIVGSGAIGSEFAYFYHTMGTEVTLVEYMPNIVPVEDEEVSKALARSFKKSKMKVMVNSSVESVDTSGDQCKVTIKTKKGEEVVNADVVLSAVGVVSNIENIGLEDVGVATDGGKVLVDEYGQTNIPGVWAIGDIVPGAALAHVASHEGIVAVEKMAGLDPKPIDKGNIPGCTYTTPEIASVGMTEKAAKEAGYDIKVGKFPFSASGKASAAGHNEGFVKLIFDAKYGELLGGHMIGYNVTEMVADLVSIRKLETTGHEIITTVYPHPTMSEAIMEAAADAYDECIHI
ncbi:dihydrolipoyl dehydrogenase [bacterium SCSIO 12643]|nr:dihydrolipoyl dehydrogenase [bacterium SCSIO 12643]